MADKLTLFDETPLEVAVLAVMAAFSTRSGFLKLLDLNIIFNSQAVACNVGVNLARALVLLPVSSSIPHVQPNTWLAAGDGLGHGGHQLPDGVHYATRSSSPLSCTTMSGLCSVLAYTRSAHQAQHDGRCASGSGGCPPTKK